MQRRAEIDAVQSGTRFGHFSANNAAVSSWRCYFAMILRRSFGWKTRAILGSGERASLLTADELRPISGRWT